MSTWVQQQKSVRTHATNRVGKTSLKNCQILKNLLEISRFPSPISRFPSPKIRFSSHKIQFPQSAFYFLQRLSAFFNGFLIFFSSFLFSSMAFQLSSTAFRFLQQLSDFSQRLSAFQEIRENLSTVASIQKITIWALYFRHSTRSPSFIIPATLSTSPQHIHSYT